MPLTSYAGGSLFGERLDSEPPRVLALHGWARRGSDFTRALEGLGTLALDLPGFGASPPLLEAVGAAGYAEAIGPIFEVFERPPVVVGHSFGGRVAVVAEAARPGSSAGLVLVGAPLVSFRGRQRRPAAAFRLLRLANRLGMVSDERMERERRNRGSDDYRAATGIMRDILVRSVNESYEAELSQLDLPVHLLWGETDSEVPVAVAHAAKEILGESATIEVIEGVGHHIPLNSPERLRSVVVAMLERTG